MVFQWMYYKWFFNEWKFLKQFYFSSQKRIFICITKFLQHTKMFNSEVFRNEKHNLKYPYIPDHPYRMLIIWGSGSGKTNVLLNLIKQQDNNELELDKIVKKIIYCFW